MNRKKLFFISLFFILLSVSAVFSNRYYQVQKKFQEEAEIATILLEEKKAEWLELEQSLAERVENFNGNAGILIKDLQSNWEISFNKDELFPSASVVKILIMTACFEAIEKSLIDYDVVMRLRSVDKASGSGVLKNMASGKEISVSELLELMITKSDNTAANMLIDRLGFEFFNESFKSYGIQNTNLSRKMVDFKARSQGVENYTTAQDMALILEKIYRGEAVNQRVSKQCLDLLKLQRVNDRIPKHLPEEIVIAHKTGLERSVCHDAGIVYAPNGDFIVCALIGHSETTSRSAKEFIADIAQIAYQHFDNRDAVANSHALAVSY